MTGGCRHVALWGGGGETHSVDLPEGQGTLGAPGSWGRA